LVFASGQKFHTFDVATNNWTLQEGKLPAIWDGPQTAYDVFDIVATPIQNYGVTMFVKYFNPTYGKVFLYKHAAGEAPGGLTPPSKAANLSATPVSLSQISNPPPSAAVVATARSTSATESSFAEKCLQSGVLGCWGFDDPSELKYTWYQ